MSYVTVSADFPGVTTAQRKEIYDCLKKKNWVKVTEEPGRDIDTVWYGFFAAVITEATCIDICIENFTSCSEKYCKVKLVIQWGPHLPTFHGLI